MQNNELLEIRTFGHVAINWRHTANPLAIPPREAALLIYLAYQRVKVSRAHLCHLFWPGETSQRAHGNLRKLLLDTRRNLASFIVANLEEVGLHQDLRYWLDVHEFQWQMQPLEQKSPVMAKSAIIETPRLQRGMQLYQGDFLSDLKQPKSHVFGAWVEQEQQRLHQQAIDALKLLAEASKAKGHFEEALGYSKRLFELDPLDEEVQELSLRLLAQMGRTEEALQQFQHYRAQLKRELALEPETHLTQLYQQIRAGVTLILPPSKIAPATHSNGPRGLSLKQIPKPLTPLLGRTTDLHQLHVYVTNQTVRLVTLVGMGGVGKSHLALSLLERQMIPTAMQPVFVPLPAVQRPEKEEASETVLQQRQRSAVQALALALAQAIGFPLTTTHSLDRQLGAYLRQQSFLLVFDGFEHWIAGATFVAELLQEAPLCKILVTAREALQLPGEALLVVEGLDLPTEADEAFLLAEWQSTSAARTNANQTVPPLLSQKAPALHLFLHTLQRQNPQIVLSTENLRTILHICRLLEGNPLAITQAAALSWHYSWLEIAEQLEHRLDILQAAYRSHSSGQRSIIAVIEDGWGLLTCHEQAILAALTGFPSAFTRHDAVSQLDSTPDTLIALVNKSWVRSKGAGLYELPRLVRLFVQAKG